jgi:hypothetical protein
MLDAAEKALRALDDGRKAEEADLWREEDEREARKEAAQAADVEARKAATGKVVDEGTEYRKAAARTEAIALRASRTNPKRLRPKPTPPPPRSNRRFAR